MWRRLIAAVALGLLVTMLGSGVASVLDEAAANILRWRERPEAFVYEQFHVDPDTWQREALQAFADPTKQRISLQACVGPGKTAVEAWCGWNFLSCYGDKGEHPKGAAVAITWDNLKDNLWPELAKWQLRSEYLRAAFTWTKEQIFANAHPETWFLSARSWPKSASPDEQGKTMSGLHSKYVLVLVDESGAIPVTVLRAADQVLSTGPVFGKILQAGNPISLEGMLYAAATTLRQQWTVIRITGDPDDPRAWVHAPRLQALHVPGEGCSCPTCWANQQIAIYGRDNPWVMSQILGQFPPASINALLGVEEVEAAMARHLRSDQYDWAEKRLGIDVARFGDDRTVIFPRQGLASFRPVVMRNARTTDIAARVAKGSQDWAGGEAQLFVDDTGHWGHGVIDILHDAGYPVIPLVYHAKALNPRYKNRRAEFWIQGAEWVKGGGALPPVPELVAELITPTYTFANGVFQLEEKDQIKKRLGRSPDLADALFETFAIPDRPSGVLSRIRSRQHVLADGDPMAVYGRSEASVGSVAHDRDPLEG